MMVFLKSTSLPLVVLQHALVEDLVEDLLHGDVGLLDLVEQHDAVRLAAHRLGQHAALAVADVAGRRAGQPRNLVVLLVLRHVDDDHVAVAAVEDVGQGHGRLGLADAAGADQQEDADRPARVDQVGPRRLDALGDRLQRVLPGR